MAGGANAAPIDTAVRIGHVHLKVVDLEELLLAGSGVTQTGVGTGTIGEGPEDLA
jgi:hypothetical protein